MTTNDLSPLGHSPWKKCSSRFCPVEGPFINKQLWINVKSETVLLGRCNTCWNESGLRGRYVCTRCALRRPASPASEEWAILICRYCGEPLGQSKEVFKLNTTTCNIADELPHQASSMNQTIASGVWWSLYQHGIKQGWLTTSGLRDALRIKKEGKHEMARQLSLLHEELERCRAASYRAGEARCLLETARVLLHLRHPAEALEDLARAEPLLREIANVTLLRDLLTLKARGQQAIGREPHERVKVLDEAIVLYRQSVEQEKLLISIQETSTDEIAHYGKTVDQETHQSNQAFEFLLREMPIALLADNRLVAAAEAMCQLPEGAKLMRRQAEQLHRQNRQEQRLRRHNPDVRWDEEALDQLRKTHDVWGCPHGHKLTETSGLVPLPREQDGSRNTCLECGGRYILLNRYYSVSATVPDILPPTFLEVADWNQAMEEQAGWNQATEKEVEQLNLALVFRDRGQLAAANEMQARVLDEWGGEIGPTTLPFAIALNLLGRVLQDRDEHRSALDLFERAARICQPLGDAGKQLLANCLNNQGCSLLCLRLERKAVTRLLKACRLSPQSPNPYYWLAKLYARRGAEAVKLEEKAWRTYLLNGVTSHARRQEARLRLAEIAFRRGGKKHATSLEAESSLPRRGVSTHSS